MVALNYEYWVKFNIEKILSSKSTKWPMFDGMFERVKNELLKNPF